MLSTGLSLTTTHYRLALPCQKSSPVQSCSSPTARECFQPVCPGHGPDEVGGQPAGWDEAATTWLDSPINLNLSPFVLLQFLNRLLCSYLTCVDWDGDVGGLREELGGSQQVADPLVVPLVLLYGLNVHLLFGQQRLVARRVASRGQELEISVASAQQEAHPEVRSRRENAVTSKLSNLLDFSWEFKSLFSRPKKKTTCTPSQIWSQDSLRYNTFIIQVFLYSNSEIVNDGLYGTFIHLSQVFFSERSNT